MTFGSGIEFIRKIGKDSGCFPAIPVCQAE